MPLIFRICPDPNYPIENCVAAALLDDFVRKGQLRSYDPDGYGNCYEVALAILLDLADAQMETKGWLYVTGNCKLPQGPHAWLEYDGWAIDFSSGQQVFTPIPEFVRVKEPENVKRFTLDELKEKSSTREGKLELGIFDESI
jgi:hypothetical protein